MAEHDEQVRATEVWPDEVDRRTDRERLGRNDEPVDTMRVTRRTPEGAGDASPGEPYPLLSDDHTDRFRGRWEEIQARFVDEPRSAVERADHLVMEVIQQLQTSFTSERETLETEWDRGGDVSTEDLRIVLQRYRSFFDRLLAA